ncbi:hypothetical protein [Paenibacillus chitinolyticus]|uniref:hypothetical protein n=1 Tax=Paenibacillus chitinolyticus TaxID=79263 RepID=UPI001C459012|nr:hypothetical protein [Paenibacillus chitinolyticus]MBV6716568.1 hypothetical protein [Paenibacillus chitinolyticus]
MYELTELKNWVSEISQDYLFYLYKRNKDFPWCCHTSANLITSYLNHHFGENIYHKYINTLKSSHGWTQGPDFVIDFTNFQFYMVDDDKKRIDKQDLDKEQLMDILTPYFEIRSPISVSGDRLFKELTLQTHAENMDLYGQKFVDLNNTPLSKKHFWYYLRKAHNPVNNKIVKNGYYS